MLFSYLSRILGIALCKINEKVLLDFFLFFLFVCFCFAYFLYFLAVITFCCDKEGTLREKTQQKRVRVKERARPWR